MGISVARLRVWLLAGAGLLVVVIAAFLGLAHYRATRFIKDLPRKLGVDIQQETTGFTYSQSDGPNGKTIYTIHAAKAVQRTDGKVNLHDVGIVLYGRGQDNERRADRIYGNEFEYDQKDGVIRAVGEVHIDLQAPAPTDAQGRTDYAKGLEVKTAADGKDRLDHLIHVTTSDLVFIQKLATAATDKDVEFTYNGLNGHAHGADFSSDTGNLVLESAVKMSGVKDGQPVVLTASRAELDRQQQKVILNRAVYTVAESESGTRVAKGDEVTAYLRHNGTVERAIGVGNISLVDENGSTVKAAKGEAHFNEQNQPKVANLSGGVRYAADEELRQARGEAEIGNADFSQNGQLKHVALTGAVHLHERIREGDEWAGMERARPGGAIAGVDDGAGDGTTGTAAAGQGNGRRTNDACESGDDGSEERTPGDEDECIVGGSVDGGFCCPGREFAPEARAWGGAHSGAAGERRRCERHEFGRYAGG